MGTSKGGSISPTGQPAPRHLLQRRPAEQQVLTRASVMMVPEADQVKTSICPGVSIRTYLQGEEFVLSHTQATQITFSKTSSPTNQLTPGRWGLIVHGLHNPVLIREQDPTAQAAKFNLHSSAPEWRLKIRVRSAQNWGLF